MLKIGPITLSDTLPFTLIAGPCQMESREHALMMAEKLSEITARLKIPFIYKTSFDKANRTSVTGKRGAGLEKALPVFAEIREKFGCPVLTDVHLPEQCAPVAEVVDVMQIPAFLCRQTDLLIAAGEAAAKFGRAVNIKKGQFLAPWDMKNAAAKVESAGCKNICLTERGASFGYNTLVVDMRSLQIMAEAGYPVIFDATHAVQQPGGMGGASGGERKFVPLLARAAIAAGVAGIFMETHENPDSAPSDGPCMVRLEDMESLLKTLLKLDAARRLS